jgi:hypothetical protein
MRRRRASSADRMNTPPPMITTAVDSTAASQVKMGYRGPSAGERPK